MKPENLIAEIVAGKFPPKGTLLTPEMVGSAVESGLLVEHAKALLKYDNLTPGAKGRLENYIRNHAEQA